MGEGFEKRAKEAGKLEREVREDLFADTNSDDLDTTARAQGKSMLASASNVLGLRESARDKVDTPMTEVVIFQRSGKLIDLLIQDHLTSNLVSTLMALDPNFKPKNKSKPSLQDVSLALSGVLYRNKIDSNKIIQPGDRLVPNGEGAATTFKFESGVKEAPVQVARARTKLSKKARAGRSGRRRA